MNLLISTQAQWIGYGIAGGILMLGISIIVFSLISAERNEQEEEPGNDMEPCRYRDIMNSERPYIEHQYN